MVLDPLTAFSVAGTVIQFVDFTQKIFAETKQIYKSTNGTTEINQEIQELATDFDKLSIKLRRPLQLRGSTGLLSSDEQQLQEICDSCAAISQTLITKLTDLKPPKVVEISGLPWDRHGGEENPPLRTTTRKWKSLQQALKMAWSEDEIKALTGRLSAFKEAIQMHILVGLRNDTDFNFLRLSDRFNTLDQNMQRIVTSLLDNGASVVLNDLREQSVALAKLLDRTEAVIVDHADRNRSIIIDTVQAAVADSIKHQAELFLGYSEDEAVTHRNIQEVNSVVVTKMEEIKANHMVENMILKSLKFPSMRDRQEEIAVAHDRTFEWIFKNAQRGVPWSNFMNWLHEGSGTYWINGKAGSGKSTLMRYIYQHPKTRMSLSRWASPLPITTANFYFWNSGTIMQRSQAGLLRSILYEILFQHRDLIPVILPNLWARTYSMLPWFRTKRGNSGGYSDGKISKEAWTVPKLVQVFQQLVGQRIILFKLCLFVDGLDEYDGDHAQIAKLFQAITSSSPNIKACLSSRPLLVFEDAFRNSSTLRLQELTFWDIECYVNDKLGSNNQFRSLALKEPLRAPLLVQEVVKKADGVFLWVKLVVISLLEGLSNRDTFSDLQRRLRLLPSDLEDLYRVMMKHIDPFYLNKASQTFQLLNAANQVSDNIGAPESDDNGFLTILSLSLADIDDRDFALTSHIVPIDEAEINRRCQEMTDRLKTRCAGLVEVQRVRHEECLNHRPTLPSAAKVQYLHRTVRDYFMRLEVWNDLVSWSANTEFEPHTALLKAFLLQLKVIPPSQMPLTRLEVAMQTMSHAHYSELITGQPCTKLLDQLDLTMTYHYMKSTDFHKKHWTCDLPSADGRQISFLYLAAKYGLAQYVQEQINAYTFFKARKISKVLLGPAICTVTPSYLFPASPELLLVLLKYGGNPNSRLGGSQYTAWQMALKDAMEFFDSFAVTPDSLCRRLRFLKILLDHGAKPWTTICGSRTGKHSGSTQNIFSLLQIIFIPRIPKEATELENLLKGGRYGSVSTMKGLRFWRSRQEMGKQVGLKSWEVGKAAC